jgi:hypothetical protein
LVFGGADHDFINGFLIWPSPAQLGHKLWPSWLILDFGDRNVKNRVIEGAEDDGDNVFLIWPSPAQLGHKLWPSWLILDFDDGNVKNRVIEGAEDDGDKDFAFVSCFCHEIFK